MTGCVRRVVFGMTMISGCSFGLGDPTLQTESLDGDVTLTTSATSYDWEGTGIEAALANVGGQPYYARLGDAFNAAEEQEVLFAAFGSDAYLERLEGDTWVAVDRVFLVEGVKFVVLYPNSTYTLFAHFTGPKVAGTYRLRVEYYDGADGGPKVGDAVSNPFEVH